MRINLYLDGDSRLHRLHPQVKLAILGATFAAVYGIDEPLLVLPVTASIGVLLWVARAGPNVRRFAPMLLLVPIATFVTWSLFYGYGRPVRPPRAEAVRFALGMGLKLECFVAASVLFLSITRVEEFTDALRGLGVPYRVSFVIALAFRLVPLFLGSALSVVAAQRARGLDFDRGSVAERLRRYMPVIVPVFMGALRRADAMAMALEARGFGRDASRATFVRSRFTTADRLATVLIATIVIAYVWAGLHGLGRVTSR